MYAIILIVGDNVFENLTREIILLSVIPVALIVLIDLIVLIIRKREKNNFKFNYFVKVSLIIASAIVLPLIGGYTIWVILSYIERGILSKNIWYVSLIIFLWICLFVLLIWVYLKTIRELKEDENMKEEVENEQ